VCVCAYTSCVDSPDYVLVRDGVDDASSPVIARYCGHLAPGYVIPVLVTSSNRATVEFVTDARNQRQGFAGVFTFVASDNPPPTAVSPASDATTRMSTTLADHQADDQLLQPKDITGKAVVTNSIRLRFDRRSTPIRLQRDRATTIRRPTLLS